MRLWVRSLTLLSGLRIQRCYELWCKSQTWLGSSVAVAVEWAGGYSSDFTPSLGTSDWVLDTGHFTLLCPGHICTPLKMLEVLEFLLWLSG